MAKKKILVPSDFSKVADCAMNHAIKLGETIGADVCVLHVVNKEDRIKEAEYKLDLYLKNYKKAPVKFHKIVRVGSIFEDIGSVGDEIDAQLIIMGTHGLKGLQFVLGSNALRVVSSSPRPFVVVQEKGIGEKGYDDIIVPLDLHQETKQKLQVVAEMAKYFDSRVHIITPYETDEFLHNKLERNRAYAEQYMKEKGIECTATVSEKKGGSFDEGIIRFASAKNADLIAIMNLEENSLMNMLGGSYVQNILTNVAQIPVMIVNPKRTTTNFDVFGMGKSV